MNYIFSLWNLSFTCKAVQLSFTCKAVQKNTILDFDLSTCKILFHFFNYIWRTNASPTYENIFAHSNFFHELCTSLVVSLSLNEYSIYCATHYFSTIKISTHLVTPFLLFLLTLRLLLFLLFIFIFFVF